MTAKLHANKELAGMVGHRNDGGSVQSTESMEVMVSGRHDSCILEANSSGEGISNLQAFSHIGRFAPERADAISSNTWQGNHLKQIQSGESDKNAAQKTEPAIATSTFIRWLRFNFVGGVGIFVQFFALFVLKSMLQLDYLVATGLAVEAAVVHNFLWHERYTWADRVRPSWRKSLARLARFNVTNGGVSIVGNLALMKVMVGMGHMNYLLANGIAIAMCSLANFLVSETWVFGVDESDEPQKYVAADQAG